MSLGSVGCGVEYGSTVQLRMNAGYTCPLLDFKENNEFFCLRHYTDLKVCQWTKEPFRAKECKG